MTGPSNFLLVIGEREALAWILREQRMAFPARRTASAGRLRVGDVLFLLTTRGCYHNPTRDRTLVIGESTVASVPVLLERPVSVAGRDFVMGCDIRIKVLAPIRQGVEVAPKVPELEVFPHKNSWSVALRRTLVPLGTADARLLREELAPSAKPGVEARASYLNAIRPVRVQPAVDR